MCWSSESAILRLKDVPAAEAFIDSAEVAVIGFFEVSVCVIAQKWEGEFPRRVSTGVRKWLPLWKPRTPSPLAQLFVRRRNRAGNVGASLYLWDWHLQCSINRHGCSSTRAHKSSKKICSSQNEVRVVFDAAELMIDRCSCLWVTFSLFFHQTEAAHGYKDFLAAAKQMEALPVALCSEKEVWAKYGIATDTISIFRKVNTANRERSQGYEQTLSNIMFIKSYLDFNNNFSTKIHTFSDMF